MPIASSRLLFASTLLLGFSEFALAKDFRVTRLDDVHDGVCDADCSLRDAVSAANAAGGDNRIILGSRNYVLSLPPVTDEEGAITDEDLNLNGDLDVLSGTLRVIGAGVGLTTISGTRVDRLFDVKAGARLDLLDLTLRDGLTSRDGGAIRNAGIVSIRRVTFDGNTARYAWGGGSGGAISNSGTLLVQRTLFQNNRANFGDSGHAWGGAIFNSGNLTVRDSLFRENGVSSDDVVALGGALFNRGTADVARSAFMGHTADGPGVTIRNDGNGVLKLTNVTVSGGSRSSEGESDAAVANGSHYPMFQGTPTLRLSFVTIAGNEAPGLSNQGNLVIRNSIIAGNGNEGSGIANCVDNGTSYRQQGLLLGTDSGNCAASIHVEDGQTFTRVLHALKDDKSVPPLPSHALRPSSPAIDAATVGCSGTDQHRYARPLDGDGDGLALCDLGAYERRVP
ncbi:choice-of-anchor Q domain-containing protein [Pseudomonas sp. LRF_L74]|uniref:choice-of-anchor Q domain-containing protein n=1 Tax=Pseudomonas sp. LRF_L74 TaxID=3369422 RepID=UPI003F643B17